MCKEGIRIGRKTDVKVTAVTAVNGAVTPGVPNNPSRIAIRIVGAYAQLLSISATVFWGVGGTGDYQVYGCVDPYHTTDEATIEQYGQLVTSRIDLLCYGGGPVIVYIVETFLTERLDDV